MSAGWVGAGAARQRPGAARGSPGTRRSTPVSAAVALPPLPLPRGGEARLFPHAASRRGVRGREVGWGRGSPQPRFTGQGHDPEVGSPPPRPHPESRPSSRTRCVTEIPTPRREQASGARRSTCARGPRWHGPACWQAAGARGSGTAGVDRPQSAPGAPQVKLAAPSLWRKRSGKSLRPGRPAGVRREKFGSGVRIGVSGPRKDQVRGGKVRGKRKKGILIWGGGGGVSGFAGFQSPARGALECAAQSL